MLCDSPIAVVLNNMPKEYSVDLCKLYLSDVIKNVHYISHHLSKEEYEVHTYSVYIINFVCRYLAMLFLLSSVMKNFITVHYYLTW